MNPSSSVPAPQPLPHEPSLLLRTVQVQVLDPPELRARAQQLLTAHHYLAGCRPWASKCTAR